MNYFDVAANYVKKAEIGKSIREANANRELVECYWNVGRLIVEAQGGKDKAKYGNELLKKWAENLTKEYGKGYDYSNLRRFRQFFLEFQNCGALRHNLSWTIIRTILPIKDENKRNYYINLCVENNLSQRELLKEIKNNSYERLEHKPDKIDVIVSTKVPKIINNFKNPILLELKNKQIKLESDLEKLIYSQLSYVFLQLGNGFAWIGNQYKVSDGNKNYFIDMLLYNIKYNCYVVVEIKCRKLKKEDKGQVEFYMKLVDEYVKEPSNNPTIGIIITKEQDKFVANFVRSEKLIPLTYELLKKWAEKLIKEYGKGYEYTNLSRFRQLYLYFPIVGPVAQQLKWTNICKILSIKDENKRNYYINLCITNNLSKRELEREIKNNLYERLEHKPDKIDIIVPSKVQSITDNFMNPILLKLKDKEVKNELDLEKLIYSQLSYVFLQLGNGFAWIGNQYKVSDGNKNYFIDMLLYNIKYNCYVVVEIKCRKLKKEDKGQVEFYMKLVDEYVKEPSNNPTIGIIITKEQDKFVANFVRSEKLIPLTYEIVNNI